MRARVLVVPLLVVAAWPASPAAAKCRPNDVRPAPFVSAAPPPADLAAKLGVLRRPQTDADRATIEAFKHSPTLRILYASSLRLLRQDPDGRTWYLYVGKTRAYRYPRSCVRRMPPSLRRGMRRTQERSIRDARKFRFGVFEFAGSASGGWFGGDLRALANNATTLTVGHPRGGTAVSALAPDGVASVELTFLGGTRLTAPVTDNLWKVESDLLPQHALPRRTVWKAADGTAIRTFRDGR